MVFFHHLHVPPVMLYHHLPFAACIHSVFLIGHAFFVIVPTYAGLDASPSPGRNMIALFESSYRRVLRLDLAAREKQTKR